MKSYLFFTGLFLILLVNSPLNSQEIKWNNSPRKGLVFEISNKEAQKLLTKSKPDTIFYGLLHTLVDTFDVQKGWINRPEKGHFILVKAVGNQLQCEYTSVFPYQVFLFKEYDALSLQVLDLNGIVREDAKIKLGLKRLTIDRESKTYRLENEWITAENKFATVELEGFRSVFNIEKHEVPTWYNNFYDNDNSPSFYSYLITDKNKYKPNELIRFKSYALTGNKIPLKKELDVWLSGNRKHCKVATIDPYRPGGYAGEFRLADSLKLTLDKYYCLQLQEKAGRVVSSCSFKYEDYELFGNKLSINLATNRQYFPDSNSLIISATDANGLLLKDAKAGILVKTKTVFKTFQTLTILPDTLYFTQVNLDPEKPTTIEIPSALFQKTNTSYEVNVIVLNSDNERMEQTASAIHLYSQYDIESRFSNDSLCFNILKNGKPLDNILGYIQYNNEPDSILITFPYKEKINPSVSVIAIKNKLVSTVISMSQLSPKIDLLGGIQKDSFNIFLLNPQKLDISWYVYQGSTLICKGFGKEIDYKSFIENRTETYYVELLYSFGGQDFVKRYPYIFKEDCLNISLDIPDRVYPGQTVDATIHVNNQQGEPVKGVDLTALAVTSKLDYNLPDLPYFGNTSALRPKNSHFTKSDINKRYASLNLKYRKWEKIFRLDTMMYYRFTYPGSVPFVYKTAISDSTQFSPYVMQNGLAKQVYVIEVDHQPVYFSWVNSPKEYSFYVSPGKRHEISLRLSDREIILDSVVFDSGKKTIISFELNQLPKKTSVIKLGTSFTYTELLRYKPLVSSIKVNFTESWLETKNEFKPLFRISHSNYSNYGNILIGPIKPGRKTYVENNSYRITYQHIGGFYYEFDDNIVYKEPDTNLIPKKLYNNYYNPMLNASDVVMNKKQFTERKESSIFIWHPRFFDILGNDVRIKIMLPYETKESGINDIIFENCTTKNKISPCFDNYINNSLEFFTMPEGLNNIIVLYNNGTFFKVDSVELRKHSTIVTDLNNSILNPANSFSLNLINSYSGRNFHCYNQSTVTQRLSNPVYKQIVFRNSGNLHGIIYDESNNPLPGATIYIKGTNSGTISDIDGNFSIQIDESFATLVISYVGYITEEIEVIPGSDIITTLTPDILALDEIVVVGYGVTRKSDLTGAIRGVMSDNMTFQKEEVEQEEINSDEAASNEAENKLYQELLNLKTIRSNFSDVGFWEPSLYTDKHGESKFRLTFPDDITRWNAVVYAMNRNLQTGTFRKSIKSYKPLMAELHIPQFLTRGDSAYCIGKLLNYSSDSSITGKVNWKSSNTNYEQNIQFNQYHINKLLLFAGNTDSIITRYSFTRNDGYTDGEERTVPVIEQGITRADGTLSILKNQDSLVIEAQNNKTVHVEILANQIEIYAEEVRYLINYKYACNEQLASKLIGLLNYKLLMQFEGKPFTYDKDVNKIIERLLKNQNQEFLWSWWDVSANTSYWMSAHILRALKCAKDAGYKVDLDIENIVRKITYKFDFLKNYSFYDIDLLNALASWGAKINYGKYLQVMDSLLINREFYVDSYGNRYQYRYSLLKEKLQLLEIRQITGLLYEQDTLLKSKKVGIMGDIYFSDNKPAAFWYENNIDANVIAYRIAKRDSLLNDILTPMQMYFLAQRKEGTWNTYHSSNILMSILPDILAEGSTKKQLATITISGKENKTITSFPFQLDLQPDEKINIKKESGLPVYLMQYANERVTEAKAGVEGFKIKTSFISDNNSLKAGEPVALKVEVEVTKDASLENVMIEVPIPAACSYADKRQSYNNIETHREYFKDRAVIFCEDMKSGKYIFQINLLPRFTGKYILNPAQVSLMYVPVVNANTNMKLIEVEDIK